MLLSYPIVLGIVLGDEERYGILDESGNFQELDDPLSEPHSKLAPLAGRLALELPCTADLLDTQGRPLAVLDINVVSERAVCTGITALPGRELTGQILRQAPISSLVREAAKGSIVHLRQGFAVRFAEGNASFSLENEIPSTRQRRTLNDEFLTQVADVYRNAVSMGVSTQQEIQSQLGPISDAAARRWVMMARRAGFLGEASGSWKAGEVTAPRTHPVAPLEQGSSRHNPQTER